MTARDSPHEQRSARATSAFTCHSLPLLTSCLQEGLCLTHSTMGCVLPSFGLCQPRRTAFLLSQGWVWVPGSPAFPELITLRNHFCPYPDAEKGEDFVGWEGYCSFHP